MGMHRISAHVHLALYSQLSLFILCTYLLGDVVAIDITQTDAKTA